MLIYHTQRTTSDPELAPYRLASWKRAPGAWDVAASILAKWHAQADRHHQVRRLRTTGRHTSPDHMFLKEAS